MMSVGFVKACDVCGAERVVEDPFDRLLCSECVRAFVEVGIDPEQAVRSGALDAALELEAAGSL